MENISFNELREILKKEFKQLMDAIPEGDEKIINPNCLIDDFPHHAFEDDHPRCIRTLAQFAKVIDMLLEHRPVEEVKFILEKKEGARAILLEDDGFMQAHFD